MNSSTNEEVKEDDEKKSKSLGDSNIVNQIESTVSKDGSICLENDTLQVRMLC